MKHSKIPLSQTIVQLCKAKEIKHIVLSPGSRNAPLTIGFTNDEYFNCYSIVDERCAAFFALGIIQKLNEPVAVVCTSGSALLNYYPAVAEAFYSDLPLIVLSADRPKYLIGIGDGQTINQKDVYRNQILYFVNLKLDIEKERKKSENDELPIFKSFDSKVGKILDLQRAIQKENELEINKAFNIAILNKGPVHINVPFDEPLYDTVDKLSVSPQNIAPIPELNALHNIESLASKWNSSTRIMVLVGVLPTKTVDQEYLDLLGKDGRVLVFTETTSNIHHSNFSPSIDKIIAPLKKEDFKKLQPEILLTFGGMIVSKKIKAFLRDFKPKEHWHIDPKKANDTFFCLTEHIKTNVNSFFKEFKNHVLPNRGDYRDYWKKIKEYRGIKHNDYLNQIPFCDFKTFDIVLKSLPNGSNIQFGNSSAIRYSQLFNLNSSLSIYCNRGTSGIDGSTSTAIGFAVFSNKQTILITGDLSFFYDSNALWNNYIPSNFRIIVVNNSGGGIFRILSGDKDTDNFDTYFETKHSLTAKQLCDMYQFEYYAAKDEDQLNNQLTSFYSTSEGSKLLEVYTPRTKNDEILLNYFKFIK